MNDARIILMVGDGHCIEYAARKEYKRLADMIMDSPGDPDAVQQVQMELLFDFLERADFAHLRSSSDLLSGSRNARCTLTRDKKGVPQVSAEPILPGNR
ncbi:MAG TPA: hypothetical protein P5346_03775 [Spirochaetota bacterium]|nr:hypothetical protein [Spirochaetota bacterium]HSA13839.1 hypothetical protein [Spirochaetota bacterium]